MTIDQLKEQVDKIDEEDIESALTLCARLILSQTKEFGKIGAHADAILRESFKMLDIYV